MKRKINIRFLILTSLAIVTTLILTVSVFYNVFKEEVLDELRIDTYILKDTYIVDRMKDGSFTQDIENLRITLISDDGDVLYDSEADINHMDNHMDRPEVIQAMENGEGQSVRRSDTRSGNTFYYAIRLDDGLILRACKESDSIWSLFHSVMPAAVLISVCLFGICAVLAHFLTRNLIKPIEKMAEDINGMKSAGVYKEIAPFIETIQKQHQDILKSSKIRQEFTANVSHELKTPLTAISGYSELIENGIATQKDAVRFAGEIQKNANRLLTLINDIIKLSRLDSSEMVISFENIDLYQIACDCVNMLMINAQKCGVTIGISGHTGNIYANRQMIEEVVYNLCDNAIRYNKKGGRVDVSVYTHEDKVFLEVRDTGIGISEENKERIFERFYRVDKSRSQVSGGTGLGLAIVKHIVAQHKAEIELESTEGKGTLLRVTFQSYIEG